MKFWRLGLLSATVLSGSITRGAAPTLPAGADKFIQQQCMECHDADTKKGNLDLSATNFDLTTAKSFETWVKVYDRVRDGEMPPKKKERPATAELSSFLKTIGEPMTVADRQRAATEGRSVWRRLNRYEYENVVRDLLNAPWLQVRDMLPEDGESHRFNKAGEALTISHVQMSGYLSAAEYALHQAMLPRVEQPPTTTRRYYAREQGAFLGKLKFSQFNMSPERAVIPLLGTTAQKDVLDGTAPVTVGASDPVKREQEAFGVVCSSYEPIELRFEKFTAPVSGHYHLRFSAYSFWAGPLSEKKWWSADRTTASRGRRGEPVTIYARTPPRQLRWLGAFDVSADPSVQELDVWLLAGESIQPDAARLFRSRPPAWHNPLAEKDGMPGVAFKWMEAEGPLYDQWPTAGQTLMFGALPVKAPAHTSAPVEVTPTDPHADARRLLGDFMRKAYRRPAPDEEVGRFLAVINGAMQSGSSFTDAMVAGYTAVLCSPGFVCVEERPGKLDEYALATRLSLFLWNSSPDAALRDLAAKGELHKPEVLAAQTERLLADPKSKRFVDAFLDYWLDLRKIGATAPDAVLYPDYYLDDLLTESAEQEPQLFFNELLKSNLPAVNLVASDFSMLNERLGTLYGIPGVNGVKLHRVQLPTGSVRGGLMTMASVLKVTANGTTTSPVLRGSWIMERILGKPPPPPPPSVPAIEPDTRGATTIRQQLDKHRTQATCAACHAKIDPAGFALESFDVAGGFRDHYRATNPPGTEPAAPPAGTKKPAAAPTPPPAPATGVIAATLGYGHNGQKFTFHPGPMVDPSGELPDGRKFKDVRSLKLLLAADPRQIARNVVQQMVTYGTGTPVRFGDRPQVEAILDQAAKGQYGVRTLIVGIVQSEMFQTK